MNTIDFNKNNFPLTTSVLKFLQTSAAIIERITALVGGNYVLSGCVETGSSISSGYVVVDGEIMPFEGGQQGYVRVVTTNTEIPINDASYTKTTKKLVSGVGAGQMLWTTFKYVDDILSRIESLETFKTNLGGATLNINYDDDGPHNIANDVGHINVIRRDISYNNIINLPASSASNNGKRIYINIDLKDASLTLHETGGSDIIVIPNAGENYRHLDTIILQSTGSGWVKINSDDVEWVNLTSSTPYGDLYGRILPGNKIELELRQISGIQSSSPQTISILPITYRPSSTQYIPLINPITSGIVQLRINTDGFVKIIGVTSQESEYSCFITYYK